MANIKSAKKRILVNRTKAERNKSIKSGVKTAIKKVYAAIDAKDKAAATAALTEAIATIDKATTKGIYHKNNAARKADCTKNADITIIIIILSIFCTPPCIFLFPLKITSLFYHSSPWKILCIWAFP